MAYTLQPGVHFGAVFGCMVSEKCDLFEAGTAREEWLAYLGEFELSEVDRPDDIAKLDSVALTRLVVVDGVTQVSEVMSSDEANRIKVVMYAFESVNAVCKAADGATQDSCGAQNNGVGIGLSTNVKMALGAALLISILNP